MLPRIFACLLVLGWSGPACADWLGLDPPTTLTSARQLRILTEEQARAARPVRLTGVVTQVNPQSNDFFVQDATAGVRVFPLPQDVKLSHGDRVELDGKSDAGEFTPCVALTGVRVLEKGTLPEPQPFNLSAEDARWLHAQWVQVAVVVRNVRVTDAETLVEVFSRHGVGTLVVPGVHTEAAARLTKNAALTVRGVCVPQVKHRVVSGPVRIHLTEMPAPPPVLPGDADPPTRMIDHLLALSSAPHPGMRPVKITGVVTAVPLPGVLIVQDASGGATVWLESGQAVAEVGSRVEVAGLLRTDGRRLALTRASVRVLGRGVLPDPVVVRPESVVAGVGDALVVRVEARIEAVRSVGNWTALTLVEGAARFEAFVPGGNDSGAFEPGSRVAVVGVAAELTPDGMPAANPGVFLASPEAVTVLERPVVPVSSWWLTRGMWYLSGGFLVLCLGTGLWVCVLRTRVHTAAGELRKHSEEKEELARQLRQAAKLEAVGRLAGGIAHDFNNLLTVINGCAELLTDEATQGGGRVTELAEDIRRAGERAAALTGQLLTFSRKREVNVSAVSLNEVVTDTVRLLDRVLGEHIRIHTSLAPDLPPVHGEAGLLHQIVMNLAVNARDAMPRGGTLTLATSIVVEPSSNGGDWSAYRRFVRLSVSDTGTGMTPEVKARLFEPFFTTKAVGTGTGLGLATVYGIVQTVRGRIRVESEVGRGTTFHIDLRIQGDALSDAELNLGMADTPLPALLQNAERLAGVTVLLVEDNEMVRELLATGLAEAGAKLLVAARPEEALRVLSTTSEKVDVLVTDVVMPGMSGPVLAERVRAAYPGVRIVFMSGYTADEVLRQGVLEDEVEFMQKPFTPEHLIGRLRRVLERTG